MNMAERMVRVEIKLNIILAIITIILAKAGIEFIPVVTAFLR